MKDKIKLTGLAIATEDVLPAIGEAAVRVVHVMNWAPALDNPVNKQFMEDYKKRWKEE